MSERRAPDGTVLRFPDTMSAEQIDAVMARKFPAGQEQAEQATVPQPQPQPQPQPSQPPQSRIAGALDAVANMGSFGFGDELVALESAVLGRKPGGGFLDVGNYDQPFGDRYREAYEAERGQREQFAEDRPYTSGIANVAGALALPLGAARSGATLMRGGAGIGANTARGAAEGAVYGGLYGAGSAEPSERAEGAAAGAGTGAAIGGVLSGGLSTLGRIRNMRNAREAAPSVADVKKASGAAYGRAGDLNPTLGGFDDFAKQAYDTLPDLGYNSVLHPRVKAVLDQVETLSQQGTSVPLKKLEQMRRVMGNAAQSMQPDERRIASALIDAFDNYIDDAAKMAAAGGDDTARAAASEIKEARRLWSQASKGEMVEQAFTKAERRAASTGSGGNADNAIRQNIRAILDNPKKVRGFTQAERDAMEKIVRGEPVQNFLRLAGKLSPSGNGLMMAITGVGPAAAAGMTGNPLLLAPAGIGMVAKALADRSTKANVDALLPIITSGGQAPSSAVTLSPVARALMDMTSGQAGGAAGSLATSR